MTKKRKPRKKKTWQERYDEKKVMALRKKLLGMEKKFKSLPIDEWHETMAELVSTVGGSRAQTFTGISYASLKALPHKRINNLSIILRSIDHIKDI